MRRGSLVTTIASGVLALVLLIVLIKMSRVDVAQLLRLLADARLVPFLALVALTGMHVAFAAEKWRLVERRIASDAEHSRRLCFSFTAIGTAAGQILPMQLATALARSLGVHIAIGRGAARGAVASVFEQMFDLAVIALCGLVSLFCLWRRELAWWPAGVAIAIAAAWISAGPMVRAAASAAQRLATARSITGVMGGRIGRFSRALADSGLFDERLTRRLLVLSVFRFLVLWLMTLATTQTAGLNISGGQLAAALPLVGLATTVAVTPGGLGVNEWTFAAALTAFGVDFEIATQCALINRVLATVAAMVIGAAGLVLAHVVGKSAASLPPSPVAQEPSTRAL